MHGHLILGEGAGFIGEDDVGAAQGFDGRQAFYQHLVAGQAQHSVGQGQRGHDGHSFGNGGHGQHDGHFEQLVDGLAPQQARADVHRRQYHRKNH